MSKQALGAFERADNGDWNCFKTTAIKSGAGVVVPVLKGTTLHPHTVFAGFNDFTAHLDLVAVEAPSISPHEHK